MESFKEAKGFYQLEVSRGQETVSATVVDGGVDTESQDADVENENNEVIANIQEIDEGPTKVRGRILLLVGYFIFLMFISLISPF